MHLLRAASFAFGLGISFSAWGQGVILPPPQTAAPLTTPNVANQFVTGYPTAGSALAQAQPAFSNLSGSLAAAQCPAGTTAAKGCLQIDGVSLAVTAGVARMNQVAAVSNQFFNSVNSSGVLQSAQPTLANISAPAFTALVLDNGTSLVAYAGSSCTNQFVTAIGPTGGATCTSASNAFLSAGTYSNITGVGTLTAGATGSGFTVNLGASTISGVLGGINGGTGHNNGSSGLTLAANLTTTGVGAATLAFPATSVTYTFPTTSGGDIIPGVKTANVFTQPQAINLNTASIPFASSGSMVVGADSTSPVSEIVSAGSLNGVFRFSHSLGTVASPTTVNAPSTLGGLLFRGYDGTAYGTVARVVASATQLFVSGSARGTNVQIFATANGSATNQVEATFQAGIASGAGTPQGLGTMNAPNGYFVGATAGLSCSGTPTSSFASVSGIVTHC